MSITKSPAVALGAAIASGELSAVDVSEAFLARSREVDPELHCYLFLDDENALAAAREADDRRANGQSRSPYDGVPIAYKDLFCTTDVPTTAGSKILEDFIPPYDATVVARGHEAGFPMLGKL